MNLKAPLLGEDMKKECQPVGLIKSAFFTSFSSHNGSNWLIRFCENYSKPGGELNQFYAKKLLIYNWINLRVDF